MEAKSLGCAFSQRLQQETDVRHVLHHPFRRAALVGVKIAHRGGEQHVVKRFGKLFRTDDAERAEQLGQVVLFLHGSALLSVESDNLCGEKVKHRLVVVDAGLADAPVGERKPFGLVRLRPVDDFPQYVVAHLVALQRVLHVMERHAAFLGYPLQVIQRGVFAQGGFQGQESFAVLRGGSLAGVDQRAHVASGEELDEVVVNYILLYRIEPEGEVEGNVEVGAPSALLLSVTSLHYDDLTAVGGINFVTGIRGTLLVFVTGIPVMFQQSVLVPHFRGTVMKVLYRFSSAQPVRHLFSLPIRLRHLGEVHHAIVDTLAGYRHFITLDVEDFNQILIGVHSYKNYDIKEKPSVGVNSTYAGRMQPIVSALPP